MYISSYSLVQKGYRCYYPRLHRYLVSVDVTVFEDVPFSSSPIRASQGEDDDLLIYIVASPNPALAHALVQHPINQVYSHRKDPPVACLPSDPSPSDHASDDDLPIALRKSKHQCVHFISYFVSYNHLSSHSRSFIVSLDYVSLPNTVHEVLSHLGWHSAVVEEKKALDDNGTCDLV